METIKNACIMYGDAGVYFRLENVSRARFHSLLRLFLDQFPVRVWNDRKRAWQLPNSYANSLREFAIETFGEERVMIDDTYQMGFDFHD
jgi:hypothetical protein